MSDVIKLLPDSVANQIAAGEVVQRPASVVKELLENAIDAGATEIKLLIRDGGSSLIQVIDNGKGMSETDARMCWERHATSKINAANDLFKLTTFGFRGEALASIAAVALVEMKTRRAEDTAAVLMKLTGGDVEEQSFTAAPLGTSIAVKNLFFNIPARRNFLKSTTVETKHIMEEFQRQAMAYPDIAFSFYNNGSEVYVLKPQPFVNRIAETLGRMKTSDFLEVSEQTELVTIKGYVAIPSRSRKLKNEQYFFANHRFIRSNYFAHAVLAAYEGVIETGYFPVFALNLFVDPAKIDVNIHPTKTEVKFEEEKNIYSILKAAVRKALGSHILGGQEEFWGNGDVGEVLNTTVEKPQAENLQFHGFNDHSIKKPTYNPFQAEQPAKKNYTSEAWNKLFDTGTNAGMNSAFHREEEKISIPATGGNTEQLPLKAPAHHSEAEVKNIVKIAGNFAGATVNGEFMVFDILRLQEKIMYEQCKMNLEKGSGVSQQLLFPRTIDPGNAQAQTLHHILPDLKKLGFDIAPFGGSSFIVNGIPADIQRGDEISVLERLLEHYEESQGEIKMDKYDRLAYYMSRNMVKLSNTELGTELIESLVQRLLGLPEPLLYNSQRPVFVKLGTELLGDLFNRKSN